MSSNIENYSYDIFISYRQKDNKGDRWVSRFVEALKTELDATFKEDISIYFDENPHDRLQETHNVDKSLEGKLKCLIFIPILSQTYCDPNSYAWQYEFLAFLKMAETDRFGKDIKLRSGNVASRILPIRIHDLEQDDIKLFEKESGSVLRAMDFVFHTASGVNRPLKVNEDHPQDNLNKIFYSDQINKVAHAIKEIILGMKTEPVQLVKEKTQEKAKFNEAVREEKEAELKKPLISAKRKLLSQIIILTILVVAGILLYPKIFKRDRLELLRSKSRISVAVMPFQNRTSNTIWDDWQNGIQDILITYLSNSDELLVRQTESTNSLIQAKNFTNYASITPAVAGSISKKLNTDVFIYGSINQAGNRIRLIAQLIDSNTGEIFKPFQIEGPAAEANIFNFIDSLSSAINNFLVISQLKEKERPDIYQYISTNSSEAYRNYVSGMYAFGKKDWLTAIEFFKVAIKIDTNFVSAQLMLSWAYAGLGLYDESRKLCLIVYEKRDLVPHNLRWILDLIHINYNGTAQDLKNLTRLQQDHDNQDPWFYHELGVIYRTFGQHDDAIPVYEKVLDMYKAWGVKPFWAFTYTDLGDSYHQTGQYSKAKKLYKKALEDFPYDALLYSRQATLALSMGKEKEANKHIEQYISLRKENNASEAVIATSLAFIYEQAGILNKAEEYYRKALSLESKNPFKLNDLAYFLVDKDRNINEGMELIEKALTLDLDEWYYADCKGWGLYKLGKYEEALEFLQKSWELKPIYNQEVYLHLEAAEKAVAGQK
ncbi:MAG: hypothetical protein A2X03_11620 [Bacteroidetes bacterium GWA2_40_15]|nr:MAG: hypothetical protein A2X03_11620 [Bacteroidetes bacterium GWA2_40_15]OFX96104.1 MAG: hypothetical protein A2X06_00435 [Bacteroidetes bacterium GWC2_40_22]HIJ14769.1 tetratricopeptide repeat protein [Candidatus Woesearchaeota archaeon]